MAENLLWTMDALDYLRLHGTQKKATDRPYEQRSHTPDSYIFADSCLSATKAGICPPVPELGIHWITSSVFRWITSIVVSDTWRIRRETSEIKHLATIAETIQSGGGSLGVGNVFIALSELIHHCGREYESIQVHIYKPLFFLGIMSSTSRIMRSVIQLAVDMRGSHSTG
ncbi:hypothetical protein TNCV_1046331 [Trichonephila clavipes]|nr:hypothetical protein TNCV_1046331 [Trichonephila clavipes]